MCNLSIRHKRLFLTRITNNNRKHMPAAWEKVVPCWNHSELSNINLMAKDIGIAMRFPMAEKLPQDNGERFFSEHMKLVEPLKQRHIGDQCQCNACVSSVQQQQQQQQPTTTTNNQQQQQNQQNSKQNSKRSNGFRIQLSTQSLHLFQWQWHQHLIRFFPIPGCSSRCRSIAFHNNQQLAAANTCIG
mgnify:CR=1 FL=1